MKFTVVTAVYNSENTVAEAIGSVAEQSFPSVEHIIIDGQSNSATLAAINAAAHHRMVVHSEPDDGIYDALNKGVSRATGDVIGFLHSDDFYAHDNVLTRVADAFEDPSVDAVYSDLDYTSRNDATRVVRRWVCRPFDPKLLKRGWMPPHPTLFLRRSVYDRIGAFDTSFTIAADYDFILRLFSHNDLRSVYIPEALYKMRLGGTSNRSLSQIRRKSFEDYRAIKNNAVGGPITLLLKNLSKIRQFF